MSECGHEANSPPSLLIDYSYPVFRLAWMLDMWVGAKSSPCWPMPIWRFERLIWEKQRRHSFPAKEHFVSAHVYRISVLCAREGLDSNVQIDMSKTLEDRVKGRCRAGSRGGRIITYSYFPVLGT